MLRKSGDSFFTRRVKHEKDKSVGNCVGFYRVGVSG